MRTSAPSTRSRLLSVGVLVVLLAVVGVELANPHSYVSEAVARIGEVGSGPDAQLTDLTAIQQLQSHFNRDTGHARLILLFSPT